MDRRKDQRGRVLKAGETQRKDGRYAFQYIDSFGDRQIIYRWKLLPTDRTPLGKKEAPSLRDEEACIKKKLKSGVHAAEADRIVFAEQVNAYFKLKKKTVRPTTLSSYFTRYNHIMSHPLSMEPIGKITKQAAREFMLDMHEKGLAYNTVKQIQSTCRSVFDMLVEDEFVVKNPFDFQLSKVVEYNKNEREPIPKNELSALLSYMSTAGKWMNRQYIATLLLLHTGIRVGELCGLTINDVDLENRVLIVNKQLQYCRGKTYLVPPKSNSGNRILPLDDFIIPYLQEQIEERRKLPAYALEGYDNYLFFQRDGTPLLPRNLEVWMSRVVARYNKTHPEQPQLSNITPHRFRHTYCSGMAARVQPKVLQYLMGHASIGITYNVYSHMDFEMAKEALLENIPKSFTSLLPQICEKV